MTEKEKAIYEEIKNNADNNYIPYWYALKLPMLKKYSYENRKKILEGMRKRGLIKFLTRNGYITNIEVLESNLE